MAEPPLLSIVTPSLNQGRYLEQAIRSVAVQDYPRIEHVVVDGGSTDETLEVLRRHEGVRWISEPDRGQADAINKGFRLARGQVLAWLNADDFYLPGAASAAIDALQSSGAGLVYGGWRQIGEDGTTILEVDARPFHYDELLEWRNMIPQPATFFTREAFEQVGGLDESYEYALDYELWLRIGARFPVQHVDRILAAFRYHPESKTVAAASRFWPETHRASRRHGGRYFSPMYFHALPERRPWLFRAVVLYRLLARGNLRAIGAALWRRLGGSGSAGR